MNLILFGAPGAGKGTQAKILIDKLNLIQISTGEILRDAVKNKSELGEKVEKIMENGELVPDEIIFSLMTTKLSQNKNKGFILDGFPRNITQAKKLDEIIKDMNLKIDYVFHINVDEDILINRIRKRAMEDDVSRKDDTSEVLVERLKVYNVSTKPVLEFYASKNQLITVNGMGTIEDVSEKIFNVISQDLGVD